MPISSCNYMFRIPNSIQILLGEDPQSTIHRVSTIGEKESQTPRLLVYFELSGRVRMV